MARIDHAKLNRLKNTETNPKPSRAESLREKSYTPAKQSKPVVSITETDTGSVKAQFRGDASPKTALMALIKEIEKAGYTELFWPTIYFGKAKKQWPKKEYPKSTAQYQTQEEAENVKKDGTVITDDDLPWII